MLDLFERYVLGLWKYDGQHFPCVYGSRMSVVPTPWSSIRVRPAHMGSWLVVGV